MSGVLLILLAMSPLDRARDLAANLRFKAALEVLAPVSIELRGDERREAVELQACALTALGRADEAEALWVQLLQVDVEAPGPVGGAPKLRAVYDRARAKVPVPPPRPPPLVEAEPDPPDPPPAQKRPVPLALLPTPVLPPLEVTASAGEPPRWLAWSLSASAIALAAVGGLLGYAAFTDAQAARATPWANETHALNASAMNAAVGANVLVAGALVTLVTSVVLHVRWR